MQVIILGVTVFVVLQFILVSLIVFAKKSLLPGGELRILINDKKELKTKPGGKLLTALQTRKNQQPYLKRAVVLLMLHTALRVSELCRLDLAQYEGKYFRNVKRKGKNRTKLVFIPNSRASAVRSIGYGGL